MMRALHSLLLTGLGLALVFTLSACSADAPKNKEVWTDPNDSTLPADFKIQGEYAGEIPGVGKAGCQVIALGQGALQAVLLPGGLPGDGWDGKDKILMQGKVDGDKAIFEPASGPRKYLDGPAEKFSATD